MSAAAEALEPHRIPFYLLDLAGEFHRYYNKPANRIIGPDRELSLARMYVAGILKGCDRGRSRVARGQRSRADVRGRTDAIRNQGGRRFCNLTRTARIVRRGVRARPGRGKLYGPPEPTRHQSNLLDLPAAESARKPAPVSEMSPAAEASPAVASVRAPSSVSMKPPAPAVGEAEAPPAASTSPAAVARVKPPAAPAVNRPDIRRRSQR